MARNFSLDMLKLLMSLMIVALHADFLGDYSPLLQYLSVNGLFRIAVPVFLIINGFFFFEALTKNDQNIWLKRVFFLYVFWMIFYSFFWLKIPDLSFTSIFELFINIIFGYHHLWYVSGILGAAILLILLRNKSTFFLILTLLTLSAIGIIIQYLGNYNYLGQSNLNEIFNMHWSHRNTFFFSYPFFCIGYLLRKHNIPQRINKNHTITFTSIGLLLLITESYYNYYNEGREGGFDNYISLLLACPFIFILFTKLNIMGKSKNIALYSSGIYFIHPLILILLKHFTDLQPTALTFTGISLSIVTSYFLIKINHKIKFIL